MRACVYIYIADMLIEEFLSSLIVQLAGVCLIFYAVKGKAWISVYLMLFILFQVLICMADKFNDFVILMSVLYKAWSIWQRVKVQVMGDCRDIVVSLLRLTSKRFDNICSSILQGSFDSVISVLRWDQWTPWCVLENLVGSDEHTSRRQVQWYI